jgi:putative tricarboxylic transport membrane protein
MILKAKWLGILTFVAFSCVWSGTAGASYYDGKTIEIIVAVSPGGGTDAFARTVARYLGKHIEGHPAVQVINKPGGATVIGSNYYALEAPGDGTALFVSSIGNHYALLTGAPSIRFSLKDLHPLLAAPVQEIYYVRADTGIKKAADLISSKKLIIAASQGPTTSDLLEMLYFDRVLQLHNVQYLNGFKGRGPARLALLQNEANFDHDTNDAYDTQILPRVKKGEIVPLFQAGVFDDNGNLVRDPGFPAIPTMQEVARQALGKDPSGPAWEALKTLIAAGVSVQKVLWVQNKVPPQRIHDLDAAVASMMKDSEFKQAISKVVTIFHAEPVLWAGPDAKRAARRVQDVDAHALQYIRQYLKERWHLR